jgi:hypothetical protein
LRLFDATFAYRHSDSDTAAAYSYSSDQNAKGENVDCMSSDAEAFIVCRLQLLDRLYQRSDQIRVPQAFGFFLVIGSCDKVASTPSRAASTSWAINPMSSLPFPLFIR